ncbi:hypothetical protein KDW78_19920 [Burkholderia cenocepacia]|uniref:DNA transfer protein p32 n=1 Tax=Burkholderia cenocepacia TaxID=95486 RepID=UPI00158B6A7F|nr:DNA transfer protein p32 [Burkholderia cenocepacia]MBR7956144.1 hypothetical protein [Burkholderia cenocepacia]
MSFGVTAAVVGGVGSLVGGIAGADASQSAANTQSDAARYSADLQNKQWEQTQKNLKPFMDLGTSAINPLLSAMGYNVTKNDDGTFTFGSTDPNNPLQQRFTAPTADQAAATPGYQFTLDQGLKSVQNSAAARGLGTSGAALKGASTYATGLANSTYNDIFNRALQTFNTNYSSAANNVNRLSSLVGNGQNAAATNGSLGAAAAGNIGNTLMSGANAQASGAIGGANALTGALNGIGNSALTYGLLNNNAGGSSISPWSMARANLSSDPIGSLNASQGWTGSV